MKLSVILKIVLVILAIITMAVGLYAHFDSFWTRTTHKVRGETIKTPPEYEKCENEQYKKHVEETLKKSCPAIALEQFFVAMVIICLIWAIVSLILSFFLDGNSIFQIVDLVLHVVCGILLLISAITFLVSAIQIDDLHGDANSDKIPESIREQVKKEKEKQREEYCFGAKIAAAILGVIQAILHIVVGVFSYQGK